MVDLNKAIDNLRKMFRAKAGQPAEDDMFQGLIHTNDPRERSRLSTLNVYRHAYMYLLADTGGEEWQLMKNWAELEEHLFIAEEGQRATDFIQALAKRQQQEQVPVTNITMQNQQPQQEKKGGWFRR